MTEWLANISIQYVIAAIVILFFARLMLTRYKSPIAKSAAEVVESALMAIALVFLLIRPFVVQAFFIPSTSMLPTLEVDDHILVDKFTYRFREPKHGEIVVFRAPPEASEGGEEKDFIKRVVGLPGDTVRVEDGWLWRNEQRLDESYLMDPAIDYQMERLRVPNGALFVMGDNRNNSNDGHKWGPLDRSRVVGKAMVIFWPPGRIGVTR